MELCFAQRLAPGYTLWKPCSLNPDLRPLGIKTLLGESRCWGHSVKYSGSALAPRNGNGLNRLATALKVFSTVNRSRGIESYYKGTYLKLVTRLGIATPRVELSPLAAYL